MIGHGSKMWEKGVVVARGFPRCVVCGGVRQLFTVASSGISQLIGHLICDLWNHQRNYIYGEFEIRKCMMYSIFNETLLMLNCNLECVYPMEDEG